MKESGPPVITPSRFHRTVDGDALVKARQALGMSQAEFAEACQHSQQFQSQIEAPGFHEVRVEKADELSAILGK